MHLGKCCVWSEISFCGRIAFFAALVVISNLSTVQSRKPRIHARIDAATSKWPTLVQFVVLLFVFVPAQWWGAFLFLLLYHFFWSISYYCIYTSWKRCCMGFDLHKYHKPLAFVLETKTSQVHAATWKYVCDDTLNWFRLWFVQVVCQNIATVLTRPRYWSGWEFCRPGRGLMWWFEHQFFLKANTQRYMLRSRFEFHDQFSYQVWFWARNHAARNCSKTHCGYMMLYAYIYTVLV